MIRCLFVQIMRNESGQAVRKELLVTGSPLQIGRAPGCNILLPDHRVNLHHAVIRRSNDGKLYIEKSEGSNLGINGSFALSGEIKPGTHILIGPYDLIVEAPFDDYDLVLSAEITSSLSDEVTDTAAADRRVTIAATGLSKRKLALWLTGIIALLFFVAPMTFPPSPTLPGPLKSLQTWLIKSWQIGETSRGHQLIGGKCDSCHQHPFEPVPDSACETCHVAVTPHVNDKARHKNVFQSLRCRDCHQEHRGDAASIIPDRKCAQCHKRITTLATDTKLADIRDFSSDHPPFKLSFRTGPASQGKGITKIPETEKAKLTEQSGIKFSHRVHLDKEGVSSPEGDTVLSCADCHQEDQSGEQFIPVTMEKSCQQYGCHSLDFKPPVPRRHLPHGSERKLMTELRDYYASAITAAVAAGEKIPCTDGTASGATQLERALACARKKALENAEILFSTDSGCGECHEISRDLEDKDAPWKVAPLTITNKWFQNAKFPHSRHNAAKCSDCHDKSQSEKSADLAIPGIKKCRECHAGSRQEKYKVANRCASCHDFHNDEIAPK